MARKTKECFITDELHELRGEAVYEIIGKLAKLAKDDVPEEGDLETHLAGMMLAQRFDDLPEEEKVPFYKVLGHGIVRIMELTGAGDHY